MDPSHITEFASPRYFDKLRHLPHTEPSQSQDGAPNQVIAPTPPPSLITQQHSTFSLPFHPRPHGGRRRRSDDAESSGDGPKRRFIIPGSGSADAAKDVGSAAAIGRRKPSFTSSISMASFKFKRPHGKNTSAAGQSARTIPLSGNGGSTVGENPFFIAEEPFKPTLSLGNRFLSLPNELQLAIITPLPMPTILNLRLVSRPFHTLISLNEGPITRYHLAHSVPHYALKLYPPPDSTVCTLQYLCGLWHRLHVSSKLAHMTADHTTAEIFLRDTVAKRMEFEPQHRRMRMRLMPLLFTMFHFFETYRARHLEHLMSGKAPLRQSRPAGTQLSATQPGLLGGIAVNPVERDIMYGYSDQTLLQLHQIFPLVLSSFSRRLRPPSYVGSLERRVKGYLKEKPRDEVYATILLIGGLRQAARVWETKGYNFRRAEVDCWYSSIVREPVVETPKSRFGGVLSLGRKKTSVKDKGLEHGMAGLGVNHHDIAQCRSWDCVRPACVDIRTSGAPWQDLVFNTSLVKGPPMAPLSREQLRPLLEDQQPLMSIWLPTAEQVILERGIVENPAGIKRNTQVLLELIREEGSSLDVEWAPGLSQRKEVVVRDMVGDMVEDMVERGFGDLMGEIL